MCSLNCNEEVKFENCGTQTPRLNLERHKERWSAGSITCSSCTNVSRNSRLEMIYHNAKKHSKATARVVHKCKIWHKGFLCFHNLREHKRKEHGAQRCWGAQNVDVAHIWEKNWKRAKSFWLTMRCRMEDTTSTTLPWILWIRNICWKKQMLCLTISNVQLSGM